MQIIVLGFGSIVTNPGTLKVNSFHEDGPIIKLEFSRISQDGRLTIVVNERQGGLSQVFWAKSRLTNFDNALANFMQRENVEENRVSYVNVRTGVKSESCRRHLNTTNIIREWAIGKNADYVIWSGLGTRFKDVIDQDFSVENGLNYLSTLDGSSKMNAVKYILNVPEQILTPLKREFNSRFNLSFRD